MSRVDSDETPTPVSPGDLSAPAVKRGGKKLPDRIGPYRVVERIGSGGMGEVFKAEQLSPVRRTVALKLIKVGMDTAELVARFETERQALALMDHASIARVFDAGATESGRPFFAMEYVPGMPITDYCDRYRLGTKARLELFVEVCEGVQHAHQKGIIHRDLKPSNVLVKVEGEKPIPKIIDFGVAKAIAQPLTDGGLKTRYGHFIGTPGYMSPEQAEMGGLDVDTRADVYSLGALLYELLIGTRVFDPQNLKKRSYEAVRRHLLEEDPVRPSTRLTTSPDSSSIAEHRSTDVERLRRDLKGDLDWIVLKALEKDRTRRYETANALALDIRRHFNDEPVRACPPSTLYRVQKFVRRNRLAVAAAAVVLVAILVGAAGAGLGFVRARAAERRATQEADNARRVSDFLIELFEVSDPSRAQGETITARELLDQGALRADRGLEDQPLIRARLMQTIGTIYRKLGFYDQAIPLLEQALAAREEHAGRDSLEAAESLDGLAAAHHKKGGHEVALPLAEAALEIRERRLGADHPDVATSLSQLAWVRSKLGEHEAAAPLFERALRIRTEALGPETPEVAKSLSDVGIVSWRLGDYNEAERLLRRALALYEKLLGPDDYQVRLVLNDLAVLFWSQARYEEAEPLLERSLEIKERVLGKDHPEVAGSLNNLAILYDAMGRPEDAVPLLRRAYELKRDTLGPEHPDVGMAVANLAWMHYRQGDFEEAKRQYARARELYGSRSRSLSMAILLRDESFLHRDRGDYAVAERQLREALEIREASLDADHPDVADALHLIGELYRLRDSPAEAEPYLARALAIREAKLDAEHPDLGETAAAYAAVLRALGRAEAAAAIEARHGG